ncbi:MAG: MDR family MFS transporter [Gammaproteobacteria bacterium]
MSTTASAAPLTPPALPVSAARHRLITLSAMLATVMQTLDMTIANVALPHMQGSLNATQEQVNWVLTSYIVVSVVVMPLTGFLAARFGRKNVFVTSVALFTLASVLCGIAQTLPEMVLYRALQGAAGATIMPLAQSLMLDINPREKQGTAMATWGAGVMLGPILGPTIGGWLTEYYSWHWVFLINLPIGILAVAGLAASLPRSEPAPGVRFDATGFVLLAVAISCAQLVLDRGQTLDWYESTEIWIETILSAGAFYLFIVHMTTTDNPFLPHALFRDRNFLTSLGLAFAVGVMTLATMALMPPFLQQLGGYSALDTGLLLAPRGFGVAVAMILASKTLANHDPRYVMLAGLLLIELSLLGMANFTMHVQVADLLWTSIVQGLGIGLVFAPMTTLTTSTIDPALRTDASSLYSLVRNIASSFGISIVVAELARAITINTAQLGEHLDPDAFRALADGLPLAGDTLTAFVQSEVVKQAALIGYLNDFRLLALTNLLAMPLVFLYQRPVATPAGTPVPVAAD